jgi:hypothetical protein
VRRLPEVFCRQAHIGDSLSLEAIDRICTLGRLMAEVSPLRHVDAMGERDPIEIGPPHQRNQVVITADPIDLIQQLCFEGGEIGGLRASSGLHDEWRERKSEPEAQ